MSSSEIAGFFGTIQFKENVIITPVVDIFLGSFIDMSNIQAGDSGVKFHSSDLPFWNEIADRFNEGAETLGVHDGRNRTLYEWFQLLSLKLRNQEFKCLDSSEFEEGGSHEIDPQVCFELILYFNDGHNIREIKAEHVYVGEVEENELGGLGVYVSENIAVSNSLFSVNQIAKDFDKAIRKHDLPKAAKVCIETAGALLEKLPGQDQLQILDQMKQLIELQCQQIKNSSKSCAKKQTATP